MNRPLTLNDIQNHLTRITYKPGWELRAWEGRHEGRHITIQAKLPNAYDNPDSSETVDLDIHSHLPPLRDTDALEEWLLWRLCLIEIHETREFLKRDGQAIFDPHVEGVDRDE